MVGRREREIRDLLTAAADNAAAAATMLVELFERWDERVQIATQIRDLEHRGDLLTHDVMGILNRSYVLPFDRRDVHTFASALDDIIDLIEEIADLIGLYAVEAPMDQAEELAAVVRDATRAVARGTSALERPVAVRANLGVIRDLEHEGDRIARGAVAALFDRGIDPMVVIRWKDLFDRLEDAVDACKTAGDRLETIITKLD
jgi:predicted phosphate transport protein (TIGR00153 family)